MFPLQEHPLFVLYIEKFVQFVDFCLMVLIIIRIFDVRY